MSESTAVPGAEFYIAIGKALSEWSMLEHSLCNLFCLCMNQKNHGPPWQAFWAIAAFEGKLKMTSAAVLATAGRDDPIKTEWAKTYRSVRKKGNKRNEIAHGTLMTFHTKKGSSVRLAPYFWAGIITHLEAGRMDELPEGCMTAKQIDDARCGFELGRTRIDRFTVALRKLLAERQKPKAVSAQ